MNALQRLEAAIKEQAALRTTYSDVIRPSLDINGRITVLWDREQYAISMMVYSNDPEDPGDSDDYPVADTDDTAYAVTLIRRLALIQHPASSWAVDQACVQAALRTPPVGA